jgi:hypothetical protein
MYGKHFASMYEGSMIGAGPTVFALWGYCIAKADPDTHSVRLNAELLSHIIGTGRDDIRKAIGYLTAEDPDSKNTEHGGRRLLHEGGMEYFVVSHEHYRSIRNRQDIKEYERERKRKQREKKNVPDVSGTNGTPASVSASESASESREGESEREGKRGKLNNHGEFGRVRLSAAEHAKLLEKHGEDRTARAIETLDAWLESTGKRRKNHYACLKEGSWVWEKLDGGGGGKPRFDIM